MKLICVQCGNTFFTTVNPENPELDLCDDCLNIRDQESNDPDFDFSYSPDNYWLEDEEDEYDD